MVRSSFRLATRAVAIGALHAVFVTSANAQRVLWRDGTFFTADSAQPRAAWMVTEGGTIRAVGRGAVPESLVTGARIESLGGRTVVPGLVDAHVHLVDAALVGAADWSGAATRDALERKVREAAVATTTVVGRNVDAAAVRGHAIPRAWLDSLAPNVPVLLFLRSGHAALANSAGLRRYADDATGDGRLLERAAMDAARRAAAEATPQEIVAAVLDWQARAHAYGVTTVGDNTFAPAHYKILQQLARDGRLTLRVRARSFGALPVTDDLMRSLGTPKLGVIGTAPDPARIRYHAIKQFVDQSLSLPPDATGVAPGGTVLLSRDSLAALLRGAQGTPMAFHVQGEAGLRGVLDAIRQAQGAHPPRHVIDHAGYASPDLLARVAAQGLAMTMIGPQLFDRPSLVAAYARTGGFRQDDLLDPVAHLRAGRAAITSDVPYGQDTVIAGHPEADGFNPWATIAAVTRGVGPDGRDLGGVAGRTVATDEAIAAYTRAGAWTLGDEHLIGRLAPGLRADFVVLRAGASLDGGAVPFATDLVERTFVDGTEVFRRDRPATVPARADDAGISPTDWTISPVIGYDPAAGTILGGAWFRLPLATPGSLVSVQAEGTSRGKAMGDLTWTRFEAWRRGTLSLQASATSVQQPYFGEGGATVATSRVDLDGLRWRARLDGQQAFDDAWRLVLGVEGRGRVEQARRDTLGGLLPGRVAPDETGVGFVAEVRRDTRDEPANARSGGLTALQATFVPAPVGGATASTLVQLDLRRFRTLPWRGAVLALHATAGAASGTPSYAWRYSLGGASLLRGAWDNRYRGTRFWAGQAELRLPVTSRFSMAGFADAGAIGDSRFDDTITSSGGGVRFALRRSVVLRLDYAATRDQHGVFFTFGQSF